ncbi:hypothetical protein COCSADRAFT_200826 [Bipolaris sorokiniana ND90Pr]|uniref:Cytochrome P450 n=1 Tax=Cochliobolus sativus (strain ND90Pr / ATCC 201652) TaxID=665912 RepID=M2T2I0_COCSN|nr:uncharacterized protein COCSADRAFT_200826 [Bipolaris sorokiniana ND90Pr]EMD63222.1 hypothetical protein COCSADRAFT_200826 [Bipolaris sorokiniana ND90Pr]
MALSLATIHTTSDLLNQTLKRLANDSDLVSELRKEVVQVLSTDDLKKIALANLKLMDSTIKQTQMMNPIAMRRITKEKVVLPTRLIFPNGQYISIDGNNMFDADIYLDPYKFDVYQYYHVQEDSKTAIKAHLISTCSENLSLGHGIHSCPGCFFVANKMKIALSSLAQPYNMFGDTVIFDPSNKLRYRRRQEELDLDSLHFD